MPEQLYRRCPNYQGCKFTRHTCPEEYRDLIVCFLPVPTDAILLELDKKVAALEGRMGIQTDCGRVIGEGCTLTVIQQGMHWCSDMGCGQTPRECPYAIEDNDGRSQYSGVTIYLYHPGADCPMLQGEKP